MYIWHLSSEIREKTVQGRLSLIQMLKHSSYKLNCGRVMGSKSSMFRYADGVDKMLLLFGFLGSIGDGLMSPLTMLVLSGVINEYGAASLSFSDQIVDKYSLRLLVVAIVVGISAFIEGVCWTRTAERQASRMRAEYLKSVLRQEVGFFDNQDASSTTFQVVSTISSDSHLIQDTIAEKIPNCLAQLSSFIFSIFVAFTLSWRLAVASLPFSLMFILPGVGFGKRMMGLGVKMKDTYGVAGGIAEQAVSSIRTVYSYVGELLTLDRFSQALDKSTQLGIKQGFAKGLMIGSMGMVFAAWAFISWVGSILVTEKGEKGGAVFISGICIILGGMSVMSALPNISFISEAITAAGRMFVMIDQVPIIDSEDGKGNVVTSTRGEIEFKDVYFSYPSRPNSTILQGFNLRVRAGKSVGLVGGSGSGKSTVISLLERFYDPVKGHILLDGCKIRRLKLKWLRSQMGLVNQEPILFATSIKENILFGKEGALMEDIVNAAKAANAHNFIIGLPHGYETQVGQLGLQLSGGQKQRIVIARALVRNPKILLLDEATSALDAQSEKTVQEALDKASLGRTTIIIAHRLSTIRNADTIVVLQAGKVVESGSHHHLTQMNNGNGIYNMMLQTQQLAIKNDSPYYSAEDRSRPYSVSASHTPQRGSSRVGSRASVTIEPSRRSSAFSSLQSSPAHAFTPIYSYSLAYSTPMHDTNEVTTKSISDPPFSHWRLLKMNSPEWKIAVLGCLGAACSGIVQPVYAYFLGSVVSVYFDKDSSVVKEKSKTYAYIFLGLGAISFVTNLTQHYNFAVMGERLTKRVREQVLAKVLTFEIGWFDQDENMSAAICSRLASEAGMVRSLIADRMQLLVQVIFSASVAFVIGLIVTWRVGLVMIAMQPLIIGSFYARSVLMKSMSEKARKAQSEGSQLASEATVNHRTITAFSSQNRILELFGAAMRGPKRESVKQSWFSGFGLFSSQFLTTASIALTYWYGGRLMNDKLVTPEHLFQAFFVLMSTGKNIADAGSMTSDIAKGSDAVWSIFAILDRKTEIEPENSDGSEVEKCVKGLIELKNVVFSYPARPDQTIFSDLSLRIEGGKTIAVVGQSGSGKSTVIALIERFYDPLKGSVEIDGRDVKSYSLRKLRGGIALVSQEPTLFAGTIRQNIVYGKDDATEAELMEAALQANAHEFISSLKDGYDTFCGERGIQLSGGQKQRVALARAILKNPSILLLDEATSALDSASESLVQEALEKMMVGRTCVVVAHRLSTIQKSDSIAVIKDGKVVEKGSHSELLQIGYRGAYYSLTKLQGSHSPYR